MNPVGEWFMLKDFSPAQMRQIYLQMNCSPTAFRQRLQDGYAFAYNGDPFVAHITRALSLDPVDAAMLRVCVDRCVERVVVKTHNLDVELRPAAYHIMRHLEDLHESDYEAIVAIIRNRLREPAP